MVSWGWGKVMQKELLIRPVSDFKRVGNTKVALMRQNVAQSFSGGFSCVYGYLLWWQFLPQKQIDFNAYNLI